MSYVPKEAKGSMWFTEKENRKGPRSPHYTGTVMLGGRLYTVCGWKRSPTADKQGREQISLSFLPRRPRSEVDEEKRKAAKDRAKRLQQERDDGVPF